MQQRLADLGFDPGGVDGQFGPGTERAVMAFQQSKGLEPDGVAGPQTLAALNLTAPVAIEVGASAISQVSVDVVAQMFPPATKRSNIATHLPSVLRALADAGLADRPMVLMALGTIRAES